MPRLKYTKTELLQILKNEINKEYIEYDSDLRRAVTYRAPSWAQDGDPCVIVETVYYGSSKFVNGRKEGYSTWKGTFEGIPNLLVDEAFDQLQDESGNDLAEF
jgi:hypothetical protein